MSMTIANLRPFRYYRSQTLVYRSTPRLLRSIFVGPEPVPSCWRCHSVLDLPLDQIPLGECSFCKKEIVPIDRDNRFLLGAFPSNAHPSLEFLCENTQQITVNGLKPKLIWVNKTQFDLLMDPKSKMTETHSEDISHNTETMNFWYYSQNGQQRGPVFERELIAMLQNGYLPKTTLVWRDGMEKWNQASLCKELVRSIVTPPPLPEEACVKEVQPRNYDVSEGSQLGAEWTNSLGMKFVPVQGTDVLFCIWKTRVQDFEAYVEAKGLKRENPDFRQGPTHPVVMVNWHDAKAFCKWLTEKEQREGRLHQGEEYCLPTDEEWSIAVGLDNEIGSTPQEKNLKVQNIYPWGTQLPPNREGNSSSNFNVGSFGQTTPVGSFDRNRYGLYDMGENASEWCEDYFNGQSGSRVLRGASHRYRSGDLLCLHWSSHRDYNDPVLRHKLYGFRCVVARKHSNI